MPLPPPPPPPAHMPENLESRRTSIGQVVDIIITIRIIYINVYLVYIYNMMDTDVIHVIIIQHVQCYTIIPSHLPCGV